MSVAPKQEVIEGLWNLMLMFEDSSYKENSYESQKPHFQMFLETKEKLKRLYDFLENDQENAILFLAAFTETKDKSR